MGLNCCGCVAVWSVSTPRLNISRCCVTCCSRCFVCLAGSRCWTCSLYVVQDLCRSGKMPDYVFAFCQLGCPLCQIVHFCAKLSTNRMRVRSEKVRQKFDIPSIIPRWNGTKSTAKLRQKKWEKQTNGKKRRKRLIVSCKKMQKNAFFSLVSNNGSFNICNIWKIFCTFVG